VLFLLKLFFTFSVIVMSKKSIDKRFAGRIGTDLPLTSKRVNIILSHPEESSKLVNAVRASRKGKNKLFELSRKTQDIISAEKE